MLTLSKDPSLQKLYSTLGHNLRESRIKANLTLRELSELSGIWYTSIAQIERGKIPVYFHVLLDLTKALNITIEDLFNVPTT